MVLKLNEKNQYDEDKRKVEVKIFKMRRRTIIGRYEMRVEIRDSE